MREAARKAIEERLEFCRTQNNGMAFGLVQLGMAAAHLGDTAHAWECVRWLSNLYWTPGQVSYHDPGQIFNLDISGGLPAVVSYMLLQSTPDRINLLPCLPKDWPDGKVKELRARGGFVVDLEWENYHPVKVVITSVAGKKTELVFDDHVEVIEIPLGSSKKISF